MNWFAHYYQNLLASNSWLTDLSTSTPIFVLFFSILLGFSLTVLREIRVKVFIGSAIFAYIAQAFINPVFSISFLHTGSRLDDLSLDTLVVMLGMAFGPLLLAACLIRRVRSLDRMMIGLLVTVCSWLIFSYHMVLINGGMKYDMKVKEHDLVAILKLSDGSFKETCAAMQLDCRQGSRVERLTHSNGEIQKQVNDYLGFYRQSGKSPLLFSDSNALITQNTPYAYAYIETNTKYRWVIDTEMPEATFKSYRALFTLFTMGVVYFWTGLIFLTLFLHHLMRYFREERAIEARGEGYQLR